MHSNPNGPIVGAVDPDGRYIVPPPGFKVGDLAFPDPAHDTQQILDDEAARPVTDYMRLRAMMPDRIAVVDNTDIRLRAENGRWYTLPISIQRETSVLLGLMVEARELTGDYESPSSASIQATNRALYQLPTQRRRAGIRYLRADDFDRGSIIPLADGGALDLITEQRYADGADLADLLLTPATGGMAYEPAILDDPPEGVDLILAHYGTRILDRMAMHIALAPSKTFDIVTATPNSGKDTMCRWLMRAAPGLIAYRRASKILAGQSQKFTVLERLLATHRVVILNEADKIPFEIPADFVTGITQDFLEDERKGSDQTQVARRGDLVCLGNNPPDMEDGAGIQERAGWYGRFRWPALEPGSRERWWMLHGRDTDVWLATYLLDRAISAAVAYEPDREGVLAAAELAGERIPPAVLAFRDALQPGSDSDWVWADDLRQILTDAGVECGATAKISRWLERVAPNAKRRHTSRNGKCVYYYTSVSRRRFA